MYHDFQSMIESRVAEPLALVLVDHDPVLRHIDHVTNDPDLSANVLIGRFRAGRTDLDEVQRQFPDRALYVFRGSTGELTQWKRGDRN
jgi:hypothetical protein